MFLKSLVFFLIGTLAGVFLGLQSPAFAAERTVVLRVPTCVWADSSRVVSSTISRIEGVKSVNASATSHTVTIVYDDAKTSPEVFVQALRSAGQQVVGKPRFLD